MVAHEYAHGYAALKQGDSTAYQLGRLTWNPLKHIDPFLTILLPILTFYGSGGSFMFGGAKPVPVMPRNYRNYKRGDIIVSMAGIVTNLFLAIFCTLFIVLLGVAGRAVTPASESLAILQHMMIRGVIFNLVLAIFNLLPIPPLDGSHVMKYLLPPAWSLRYQQVGRFGMLILLVLIGTNIGRPLFSFWMTPVEFFFRSAARVFLPFVLQSPFGAGIG
jgi:Zn-dependent protease